MAKERDERWVYVALAALAVAYLLYRYRGSIDLSGISFRWARKLGTTAPYVFATIFGVLFQFWNRKRLERLRKKWEQSLKLEGVLRQGLAIKVWFGEGMKGSFQADVHLTRSALYLFDRAGRREPARYALYRGAAREPVVVDATLAPGQTEGAKTVRVHVQRTSRFTVEFATPDSEAWWLDIRRALGKPVSRAEREAGPEEGRTTGRDEADENEMVIQA